MSKVYLDDLRRDLICTNGLKAWFGQHGLDFRDFIKNGIEREKLVDIDCELMREVLNERR